LLIMGFGVPGRFWKPQIKALAASHRVAWFDNPGAGNTRPRKGLLSIRAIGDQAAGLLDALGWSDAHVVGVSMGGMIAQALALGHRRRIRSLSLMATHAGGVRNLVPSTRGVSLFLRGFLGPRAGRLRALQELAFPPSYLAGGNIERLRASLG